MASLQGGAPDQGVRIALSAGGEPFQTIVNLRARRQAPGFPDGAEATTERSKRVPAPLTGGAIPTPRAPRRRNACAGPRRIWPGRRARRQCNLAPRGAMSRH